MTLEKHPHFIKSFKKRIAYDSKLIGKVEKRLALFLQNPRHPLLRDHALIRAMRGYRAFWITADIRIIYYLRDTGTAVVYDIGSHNQVY
jgi:addiction module RelE/StbE family toxin